jgi:hypothetical protein
MEVCRGDGMLRSVGVLQLDLEEYLEDLAAAATRDEVAWLIRVQEFGSGGKRRIYQV